MDIELQAALRRTVAGCRLQLEPAVAEELQGRFGIRPDGVVEEEGRLGHLSAEELQDRRELVDYLAHLRAGGVSAPPAVERLVREIAFTHLNRLVAFRLMEDPSRRIIREAVGRGPRSNGFKFYLADHPEEESRVRRGEEDVAYRHFLEWLGQDLASQIGVLFSPLEAAGRLFPPQRVLDQVLGLLNDSSLAGAWSEDETVGWVYQYFTPPELRAQAREESRGAPRDAYELAFRNQFYTPRYVVRFLVDNTLGRLWYEMRQGRTALAGRCSFLVVPPAVPDRPAKDPRDILVIDPACGSGHFLLYAYDLLELIYGEAWEAEAGPTWSGSGRTLREDYPDRADLERALPGLILEHNLHGIDIDRRAVQITALALWLRAQKSFRDRDIARNGRPAITRSNVVAAEPMPGEADLLAEFVADLQPPLLGELVKRVFDGMRKADEIGSLLKPEEDLAEALEEARGQSRRGQRYVVAGPPLLDATKPQALPYPLAGIEEHDETFWADAESRVLEALKAYAERAENGRGFTRRLFVNDTARGFGFISLCRKRYDVVLMNPPFGEAPVAVKDYLTQRFPRSKQDLACAFVEGWLGRCVPGGKLGAITTRTPFFLTTSRRWREEVVLGEGGLDTFVDLGYGVLESMVETAAYTLTRGGPSGETLFLRLVKEDDKENALAEVLGRPDDARRFTVAPASLREVPGTPFAYWVGDKIRRLFRELLPFESEGRTVRQGLATADDFRFLRLWWEVSPDKIVSGTGKETRENFIRQTFEGKKWVPFAKGGAYSPYYADLHLVVNWERDGEEIRNFRDPKTGRTYSRPQNTDFYFRPGLTWPLRAKAFSAQVLPKGTIFSVRGYAVIAPLEDLPSILGVMASRAFDFLFKVLLGRFGFPEFVVGALKKVPFPRQIPGHTLAKLGELALKAHAIRRYLDSGFETSRFFSVPCLVRHFSGRLGDALTKWRAVEAEARQEMRELQGCVDQIAVELYGFDHHDVAMESDEIEAVQGQPEPDNFSPEGLAADVLSWFLGAVYGRFRAGVSREASAPSRGGDPFDPLPAFSPAMFSDASEGDLVLAAADGLLSDDPALPAKDIVELVRKLIECLWPHAAQAFESDLSEVLGVRDLRDYFRSPGGFFSHQITRYTHGGRKAPIYWLLQSPRRSYSLWLYYHRLDRDTLYKALTLYVEPKLRLEEEKLRAVEQRIKSEPATGHARREHEREAERQAETVADIREFRDRLDRVARLDLVPDLDDGVILNMAPLWELVPWSEPKRYWDELLSGKYEWSSMSLQLRERGLVATAGSRPRR